MPGAGAGAAVGAPLVLVLAGFGAEAGLLGRPGGAERLLAVAALGSVLLIGAGAHATHLEV